MRLNPIKQAATLLGFSLTMFTAHLLPGCSDLPACDPHTFARLNARWISEATAACLERRTLDECPVWPSIAKRYRLESGACAVASELVVRETVNATLGELRQDESQKRLQQSQRELSEALGRAMETRE